MFEAFCLLFGVGIAGVLHAFNSSEGATLVLGLGLVAAIISAIGGRFGYRTRLARIQSQGNSEPVEPYASLAAPCIKAGLLCFVAFEICTLPFWTLVCYVFTAYPEGGSPIGSAFPLASLWSAVGALGVATMLFLSACFSGIPSSFSPVNKARDLRS